tara:strand:+ start:57 stop:824 length:768 start_codon:yes stop_codon:yes gene_type:complete
MTFWQEQLDTIRYCLDNESIETYRAWEPVSEIPLFTKWNWIGYLQGAEDTYHRIKNDESKFLRWKTAMSPRTWGFNQRLYNQTLCKFAIETGYGEIETTSYNLKSNHNLETYKKLTSKDVLDYDRIVEFGGGVGDLSKLIFDLGYDGEYILYDFPEILEIQKLNFISSVTKPIFTTDIPLYSNKNTLFISTWALSEAPLSLRHKFLDSLQPENWLIVTQRHIFDIDNDLYFRSWNGVRQEIPWIGWNGGSYYLVK